MNVDKQHRLNTTMKRYGLYSIRDAAQRLKRNPELVRRWLREERLKGMRLGRTWLIDERELARFERHQPRRWKREG